MSVTYTSKSTEDTAKLAKGLASRLSGGDLILFYGGLGAGKTTFTKSLAEGLGILDDIHSPTFTLIHEHLGKTKLFHVDLYRLETLEEIINIGIEEYIYSDAITVIEWSERLKDFLPKGRIEIKINIIDDNVREFVLSSDKETYNNMLAEVVACIS